MNFHALKTVPSLFKDVMSGIKTFDVRKNDRDFQVGDTLVLQEYTEADGFTGAAGAFEVVYLLPGGWGLQPGYVIMGIRKKH